MFQLHDDNNYEIDFSSREKSKRERWYTNRFTIVGIAIMGLLLIIPVMLASGHQSELFTDLSGGVDPTTTATVNQ